MNTNLIPDPETTPHLTVAAAAEIYGVSMPTAYDRCNEYLRNGDGIPCLRLGRKVLVLTSLVRKQFGLDNLAPVVTSLPLPDPEAQPTITVAEAATLIGINEAAAARLANRFIETGGIEGLPCVRVGTSRTVVVPNDDALRAYLGRDLAAASAA